MVEDEKRTNDRRTATVTVEDGPTRPGVGARQEFADVPGRGGGYQETCTDSNFPPERMSLAQKFGATASGRIDPRLAEIETMGLSRMWLDIAAAIGVDAFLHMWRVLDGNPANWDNTGKLRIHLRRYASYRRFQRNRYIEELAIVMPPIDMREIRRRVEVAFGEKLSKSHLEHICQRGKNRT